MGYEYDRDRLKKYLPDYVERITQKSKGGFYVCPLCGSGTGPNGTGAFKLYENNLKWKCFKCDNSGDIFDLIGIYEGIEEYADRVKRAGELYAGKGTPPAKPKKETERATQREDYTQFFLQANQNIEATNYHRGITLETLNRFKVGYVAEWKHPKAPNAPETPRLIIPTSKHSYLARDTRDNVPPGQENYVKSKVGQVHIFNESALQTAEKPIFVVEGEIDALSIIDVGGEAIALGSAGQANKLIELAKINKPTQPLILSLDNDKAGQKASQQIEEGLQACRIPFFQIDIAKPYKDANEALQRDRDALKAAVEWAEIEVNQRETDRAAEEKAEYMKTTAGNNLQGFMNGIKNRVNTPHIETGFKKIDAALDGGLYEGLYIVGAVSSLGKTTLLLQVADQIAQKGKDVLIFSLEMARYELMAKSISRHTVITTMNEGGDTRNAKTARGITAGERYENYSKAERELIQSAIMDYKQYADHIFISEGIGDIGTEQIRKTIEDHIRLIGTSPVVVIDYLQILAPKNDRASDKQNTDKNTMELKRISRDFKIPVLAISSFNRANYKEKVTMEAFKESGAIEYSSDVLIGLQFKGAGGRNFDITSEKQKDTREVEFVILKNRNGKTGTRIDLNYYPIFNLFEEQGEE